MLTVRGLTVRGQYVILVWQELVGALEGLANLATPNEQEWSADGLAPGLSAAKESARLRSMVRVRGRVRLAWGLLAQASAQLRYMAAGDEQCLTLTLTLTRTPAHTPTLTLHPHPSPTPSPSPPPSPSPLTAHRSPSPGRRR